MLITSFTAGFSIKVNWPISGWDNEVRLLQFAQKNADVAGASFVDLGLMNEITQEQITLERVSRRLCMEIDRPLLCKAMPRLPNSKHNGY